MVSRRNVLQGIMSLAASPVLPKLPPTSLAEIAAPFIADESLKEFIPKLVGWAISSKTRMEQAFNHASSKKPWHDPLSDLLEVMSECLQMLEYPDWEKYIDTNNPYIWGEDDDPVSLSDLRIFRDRPSIEKFIHDAIDSTLPWINDGLVPDKYSPEDKIQICFNPVNKAWLNLKSSGGYSRNDLCFIIEADYAKRFGYRPKFFKLPEMYEKTFNLFESHPLGRLHRFLLYDNGYEETTKLRTYKPLFFSDNEFDSMDQLAVRIYKVTDRPDWMSRGEELHFTMSDLKETAESEDFLVQRVEEKYRVALNNEKQDILERVIFVPIDGMDVAGNNDLMGCFKACARGGYISPYQMKLVLEDNFSKNVYISARGRDVIIVPRFKALETEIAFILNQENVDQGLIIDTSHPEPFGV